MTIPVDDQALALQAGNDLLRDELEGLYREKDQVSKLVKILQAGGEDLEHQLGQARQEFLEILILVRKVDQLYGPFQEFDDLLRRDGTRSPDRSGGVTRVRARYL